jgi:NAD(P)-dependent dehydrogenase (short-subunit alcohol dehydrogenase family)
MNICITGTAKGVGLALVEEALSKNWTVFAGIKKNTSENLDVLKKRFRDTLYIVDMDISNNESVKKACSFIGEKTESIDVLINNAAILGNIKETFYDAIDYEDALNVYNINALGPLRVTSGLINLVLKSKNKLVVNISSEAGCVSINERENWFSYCMSKSALNMQSKILHNFLKDKDGQVLVIHPGWVKSYMQGKLDEKAEITTTEAAQRIIKIIENRNSYKKSELTVLDNLGNEMPW